MKERWNTIHRVVTPKQLADKRTGLSSSVRVRIGTYRNSSRGLRKITRNRETKKFIQYQPGMRPYHVTTHLFLQRLYKIMKYVRSVGSPD